MEWSEGESFDGLGSDLEQIFERKSIPRHLLNDYTLGMKVLECHLMKKAFNNVKSERKDFDLNVAFAKEVLHFPYQDSLQRAAQVFGDEYALNWCAFTSDNANLATLLGGTYRLDPENHAKVLLSIDSTTQDGTQDCEQPRMSEGIKPVQDDTRQGQSFLEETQQLPQYAMRLNEFAQMQEFRISWDETPLSLDPPKFRAATRIQGQTFEGVASNKKTARHVAAKRACITLKI